MGYISKELLSKYITLNAFVDENSFLESSDSFGLPHNTIFQNLWLSQRQGHYLSGQKGQEEHAHLDTSAGTSILVPESGKASEYYFHLSKTTCNVEEVASYLQVQNVWGEKNDYKILTKHMLTACHMDSKHGLPQSSVLPHPEENKNPAAMKALQYYHLK